MLDVRGGVAVHARRGERERYAPVRSCLAPEAPGDALALAGALRALGARRLYVADLDAIMGGAPQVALLARLAALGFAELLVDAGARTPDVLGRLGAPDMVTAVCGLETLDSFAELASWVRAFGAAHVVLSLDHDAGAARVTAPLRADALRGDVSLPQVARQAWRAGVRRLLLLDLRGVGAAAGPDVARLAGLVAAVPGARWLLGGGVRHAGDLAAAAAAGCEAVLVATALHEGAVGAADLRGAGER